MKICANCQKKNRSEASFCWTCGSAFKDKDKDLEQALQTALLSDPATSAPLEAEPPRLLPLASATVQTGESSFSSMSAETEEWEVETGPLEPAPTLLLPSESETDEDRAISDAPPVWLASTEGQRTKNEPDPVAGSVSEAHASPSVTDVTASSEPEAAKTVDLSDLSQHKATPTAKLPPLLTQSAPATINLSSDSEADHADHADQADEAERAPDTLTPDQVREEIEAMPNGKGEQAESAQSGQKGQNDETEPIPTLVSAPSTGELPPLPPDPLSAGDIVAERYKIVAWLKAEEAVNLYSAEDLHACGVCGFNKNPADEQFCWDCGVDRTDAGAVLGELREGDVYDAAEQGDLEAGFIYHDLFYLPIVKEVESPLDSLSDTLPEPLPELTRRTNRTFSVGYASHVGMIRRLNEDSLSIFTLAGVYESISNPSLGLFIVADGLGGHDGGEFASKFVVQTIADRLIRRVLLPKFNGHALHEDAIMPRVEESVVYANEQLHNLAVERQNDMGCTLTMALVIGMQAYIANVGDSRTYIFREAHLRQITQDHSLIASLISAGIAQPHEIYTHPERNVIYRSMGHAPDVEVDLWQEALQVGDQLLLCSDGLWETIHNEGIIEVLLTHSDAQAACDEMTHRGNLAGGEDNITVVLVKLD